MRVARHGVKELEDNRCRARKALLMFQAGAAIGILFFSIGRSIAQKAAPSTVFVALQRFCVQKLAEEMK
jgi:hypothetical protein